MSKLSIVVEIPDGEFCVTSKDSCCLFNGECNKCRYFKTDIESKWSEDEFEWLGYEKCQECKDKVKPQQM